MASMTGSTMTPSSSATGMGGNGGLGAGSGTSTTNPSVDRVAQSAHQTVDRLAEKAAPAIDKLRTTMSGANESLKAQADQLKQMQSEWTESARTAVRENPIAAVAVAVAAGVLISKIFSSSR